MPHNIAQLWYTLPKFNSSPLKSYLTNRKGSSSNRHFSRGKLAVKLWGWKYTAIICQGFTNTLFPVLYWGKKNLSSSRSVQFSNLSLYLDTLVVTVFFCLDLCFHLEMSPKSVSKKWKKNTSEPQKKKSNFPSYWLVNRNHPHIKIGVV